MSSPSSNPRKNRTHEPLGLRLERLYAVYSDARYISPDPLETVLPFREIADREIAALAASSLAYGRVAQILNSLRIVFGVMGGRPADYIRSGGLEQFRRDFRGFKHRFHTGEDLALLFEGVRSALKRYGSLEACFAAGFDFSLICAAGNDRHRICLNHCKNAVALGIRPLHADAPLLA